MQNTNIIHIQDRPIPTTQLLHFSCWYHVIALSISGLLVLLVGLIGLISMSASREPTGSLFGGLVVYLIILGLAFWWGLHCLRTLQALRQHAEELRLQLLTQTPDRFKPVLPS